ncbi:MAG: tyrosine-type recombinase/integrase [Ignavibacteriae bacterium]|nr:tyrosine-type recombinase/integrase [Ignavibacteriota bacterium]
MKSLSSSKKFLPKDTTHNLKSFRSTFAILLLNADNPIEYVSAQLGHASIETTQKYYRSRLLRLIAVELEVLEYNNQPRL